MDTRKKITIQDIADKANVSISTVSRVLNGKGNVAGDKELAVRQAIQELNYTPNLFAQGLAGGQSMTVGILTQDISSPLYNSIIRGVLDELSGSSYFPLMADGNWKPQKELAALADLLKPGGRWLDCAGGEHAERKPGGDCPRDAAGGNCP